MAVKHLPTEIVHNGTKGGTNTNEYKSHWVNTNSKITCNKNGCKN